MTNVFAVINGMPDYGERANVNNVSINDIITCKVNGLQIFCKVDGTTLRTIKVTDLRCEINNNKIDLYPINIQNRTTAGALKDTRRIFKVTNIKYS